jgi:hypothetical protein
MVLPVVRICIKEANINAIRMVKSKLRQMELADARAKNKVKYGHF